MKKYFAVVVETVVGYIVGYITNFCQLFLLHNIFYKWSSVKYVARPYGSQSFLSYQRSSTKNLKYFLVKQK